MKYTSKYRFKKKITWLAEAMRAGRKKPPLGLQAEGGPQGSGEGRSDPRPTPTPRRTVKAEPVPEGSVSRVVVVEVVPVGAGGRGGGGTNLLPLLARGGGGRGRATLIKKIEKISKRTKQFSFSFLSISIKTKK